jgi:hypothetical protein
MQLQRYVSPDLTHFVGQHLRTGTERYRLLKRILKRGLLRASPRSGRANPLARVLLKNTGVGISSNEGCVLPVVCFQDFGAYDGEVIFSDWQH